METILRCCGSRKSNILVPPPFSHFPTSGATREEIYHAIARLRTHPEDKAELKKTENLVDQHSDVFFAVLKDEISKSALSPETIAATPAAHGIAGPAILTGITDDDRDWVNSVGEQRCTPLRKIRPENLRELVNAVIAARDAGLRVRAIGSGHAFSDVARTDDAILINPILLNDVKRVDETILVPNAKEYKDVLVSVQAGASLRSLKVELDNRGLALLNMGGYDAQTIAGTFATGTHGSGIRFGPMSDFVRAVVLVTSEGDVLQVERTQGITDSSIFSGEVDGVPTELRQDDEWFRAVATGMGCMGIAYRYIIETTPAYSVREARKSTTWDEVRESLVPDLWNPLPPPLSENDHFELVLNPYNRWFRHACVRVERNRIPGINVPREGQRQDWLEALLQEVSLRSAPDLVNFLNSVPVLSPLIIDKAIMTLVYEDYYVDKSFNVFSLGSANDIKGMAIELHCDARETVPTIDKLLRVLHHRTLAAAWYLGGPIGVRWVDASDAFLAPQAGRLTCTIELTMLVGVATGRDLLRHVKEELCGSDNTSVRVHWGDRKSVV